jgi:hypothetical protein
LDPFGASAGHLGWIILVVAGFYAERSWMRVSNVVGVASLCWTLTIAVAIAGLTDNSSADGGRIFHHWLCGWLVVAVGWTLTAGDAISLWRATVIFN